LRPPYPARAKACAAEEAWNLDELVEYLGTWSAVARYRKTEGRDPLPELRADLQTSWGAPEQRRQVTWPLSGRLGRID